MKKVFIIVGAVVAGLVVLIGLGTAALMLFAPSNTQPTPDPSASTAIASGTPAQSEDAAKGTSGSEGAIEEITGEATIAKVRIALNGKKETRPDFKAVDAAANQLRGEHYDVKVFDHKADNSEHWKTTLRSMASSDAEFLVAGTGQFAPWIQETAQTFPNKYFITWDTGIDMPNVTDIRFDNQRGSWLAGRVAGLATKDTELFPRISNPANNVIGVVAAFPGADSDAYVNGFRDGAKSVNAEMDVRVIYTNSHDDATQANNAATQLYNDGAEVVFSLVGKGQEGVLAAARTANKHVITVGTEDTKSPKEPVIATLTRPLKRELVDLVTSNSPESQRTVEVGVGQDDVYLEVRPDLNPKVAQAVDDQIEAWDKEKEKK